MKLKFKKNNKDREAKGSSFWIELREDSSSSNTIKPISVKQQQLRQNKSFSHGLPLTSHVKLRLKTNRWMENDEGIYIGVFYSEFRDFPFNLFIRFVIILKIEN